MSVCSQPLPTEHGWLPDWADHYIRLGADNVIINVPQVPFAAAREHDLPDLARSTHALCRALIWAVLHVQRTGSVASCTPRGRLSGRNFTLRLRHSAHNHQLAAVMQSNISIQGKCCRLHVRLSGTSCVLPSHNCTAPGTLFVIDGTAGQRDGVCSMSLQRELASMCCYTANPACAER